MKTPPLVFKTKQLATAVIVLVSILLVMVFASFQNILQASQPSKTEISQLELTDLGIESEKDTTLVWFSARWCSLCATLEPKMENVGNKYTDTLDIRKIDIDENIGLSNLLDTNFATKFALFDAEGQFEREFQAQTVEDLEVKLDVYLN